MILNNKKFVMIISGPTGVGKTNYIDNLTISNVEIINADIGSFYTHLTIGTAKPDWRNQAVPHHFFDVIDDTTSWTAPYFRQKLQSLIPEIWSRGNIPVIVGGSAFYVQAFFYQNHELIPPTTQLIESLEIQNSVDLWEQLQAIDPDRAKNIDMNDHYRLVRALAIWHTQHVLPSKFAPEYKPLAPFHFIVLARHRDQLYEMINQRVDAMMQAGWLQEVTDLAKIPMWHDFLQQKKMIGYDLLLEHLETDATQQNLPRIVDLIAQRTRNYAKRQITFLSKLQQNVKHAMMHEQGDFKDIVEEIYL